MAQPHMTPLSADLAHEVVHGYPWQRRHNQQEMRSSYVENVFRGQDRLLTSPHEPRRQRWGNNGQKEPFSFLMVSFRLVAE